MARPEAIAKAAVLSHVLRRQKTFPLAIASELSLSKWTYRADLVIAGKNLSAYEIKTKFDKLDRLQRQLNGYSKVFDFIYVAASTNHINKILDVTSDKIGIVEIMEHKSGIRGNYIRKAKKNLLVDLESVLQLLPSIEIQRLLRLIGHPKSSKLRRDQLEYAAQNIPVTLTISALKRFLINRYGTVTENFINQTRGRPISAEDVSALRLWDHNNTTNIIGKIPENDPFLSAIGEKIRPDLGDVPADIMNDLGFYQSSHGSSVDKKPSRALAK